MVNDGILRGVDPKWRSEFRRFIETGEASEEFLRFLDTDQKCQEALDEILTAQGAAIGLPANSAVHDGGESAGVERLSRLQAFSRGSRWRAVQPYAMAASLLCALLSGVIVWNFAGVDRADVRRLAVLENQKAAMILAKESAERRSEGYQARLAAMMASSGSAAIVQTAEALRSRDEAIRRLGAEARQARAEAVEARNELSGYRSRFAGSPSSVTIGLNSSASEAGGWQVLPMRTSFRSVGVKGGDQIVVRAMADAVTGKSLGAKVESRVHMVGGAELPAIERFDFRPSKGDGKPVFCEFVLNLPDETAASTPPPSSAAFSAGAAVTTTFTSTTGVTTTKTAKHHAAGAAAASAAAAAPAKAPATSSAPPVHPPP